MTAHKHELLQFNTPINFVSSKLLLAEVETNTALKWIWFCSLNDLLEKKTKFFVYSKMSIKFSYAYDMISPEWNFRWTDPYHATHKIIYHKTNKIFDNITLLLIILLSYQFLRWFSSRTCCFCSVPILELFAVYQ